MTLLDAPKFDEKRARRNERLLKGGVVLFFVLVVAFWLTAGRPVDWPWRWQTHFCGRMATNGFFKAIEVNDLPKAYGVWIHDKKWQEHPKAHSGYSFDRFAQDWGPQGGQNDYGAIHSHRIAATHMHGNVLMIGVFVNDMKSKAINLDYDPHDGTLNFSPDDVQFLEGPGGIQ